VIKPTERLKQVLALKLVKGFTPKGFVDGLSVHGSLEALFNKSGGVDSWEKVDKEIELCAGANVEIVTYLDEKYPALLKEIYDPPMALYVKGTLPDPAETLVAMVGSRECSLHGLEMAASLAEDLAAAGAVIVSGLARGIDTASHEGALKGKGRTLAVLGCGLGWMYPPENRKLAERIVKEGGALIAEFPFGTKPRPAYFPQRNRIISGMSRALVVVEARQKSGALITADLALEQGREVYAVPGNAASKKTLGSNILLKQGARLVTSSDDLLVDLGFEKRPTKKKKSVPKAALDAEEKRLLGLLQKAESLHLDDLVQLSELPPQAAMRSLTTLSLKGVVREMPGKYFMEAES
jgi:DNA processing protein